MGCALKTIVTQKCLLDLGLNQRGSLAIFLAVIPVLLTLIAGSVVASVFVFHITSTQGQCYRLLFDLQRKQLRQHRRLVMMNAEAKSLRLQRARANAAVVAAASNPPALAAAKAVQLAVIARQLEFRTRQSLLHNEILLESRGQTLIAQRKISNSTVTAQVTKATDSPFRDSPSSSLSPDKVYVRDAEEKQRIGLSWAIRNPLGMAQELIRISKSASQIEGTCDVSIASKGGTWVPVISGDRS